MTVEHLFEYRQAMQGVYVHIKGGWPGEGFLQCWGRAPVGWYGLIACEVPVVVHGKPERVSFAAWVPAGRIAKPSYVGTARITRLQLAANPLGWPRPTEVDADHFIGVWESGDAPLPAGVEFARGPAWQRRG